MKPKYKKRLAVYERAKKDFWEIEYRVKSFEEKIAYWTGSLHSQIRWNAESGLDEMTVFSKISYEEWKLKEPKIDDLLPHIIKNLGLNKERVYKNLEK